MNLAVCINNPTCSMNSSIIEKALCVEFLPSSQEKPSRWGAYFVRGGARVTGQSWMVTPVLDSLSSYCATSLDDPRLKDHMLVDMRLIWHKLREHLHTHGVAQLIGSLRDSGEWH